MMDSTTTDSSSWLPIASAAISLMSMIVSSRGYVLARNLSRARFQGRLRLSQSQAHAKTQLKLEVIVYNVGTVPITVVDMGLIASDGTKLYPKWPQNSPALPCKLLQGEVATMTYYEDESMDEKRLSDIKLSFFQLNSGIDVKKKPKLLRAWNNQLKISQAVQRI